jgi:hypothetical protein
MSDSSIVTSAAQRIRKGALELARHVLIAALGTAVAVSEISGVYRAKTLAGSMVKDVIISAIFAFLLGALSQHLRPSNLTRWVWLLGLTTLAFNVRVEPASVLDGGGTGIKLISPLDLRDANPVIMWLLSVRLVAYSIGGIFYTWLATRASAASKPSAVPNGGLQPSSE